MSTILAGAAILILIFINGGVLYAPDPTGQQDPWVIIDGKKVPRREDGRYIIDGIPTLAIEGQKSLKQQISTHAPTSLFPKVNLSELLKTKKTPIGDALKKTTEQVEKRNKELNRLVE